MPIKYTEVDLTRYEKVLVLEYASFYIEGITVRDLKNDRKKWIRFETNTLNDIISELCYYYNRCTKADLSYALEELSGHLENYRDALN